MIRSRFALITLTAGGLLAMMVGAGQAQEDAGGGAPSFKEGDVITYDNVEALRPYLPEAFWNNRDFFFYPGMQLEIGPFYRDYSPAEAFQAKSVENKGEARIGPGSSLENYVAGEPFRMEDIDCLGDPEAGAKIMWNFDYRWRGAGNTGTFFYSYWDRGEELPLYYEGKARNAALSYRVEPKYRENDGDLFRNEKRTGAFGIEVTAPFDARGIMLLSYRYKSSDMARVDAKNDDTWVYVPTLRRVRRISTAQRTDSIQSSRNLLLTGKAHVDTKPQLEIFADDVKCAHGATVGQLDNEEVFYLKSRGLSDSVARNLLTYAFGAEIIDRIPVASLKHRLEQTVLEQTTSQP